MATNDSYTPVVFRHIELTVLKLSTIKEDDAYQRALVQFHVDQIIANWFRYACLPLACAVINGNIIILDGRHRLNALRRMGETEWPCSVQHGMTAQDFFRAFDIINGRGKLSMKPIELFRFGYKYGDPMRVAIMEAAAKYKLHIPIYNGEPMCPNSIRSYKAMEMVYAKCGQRTGIFRTFRVLSECFVTSHLTMQLQKGAGSYPILVGMGRFLTEPSVVVKELIGRLKSVLVTASQVFDEAAARANAEGRSGSNSIAKHVTCVLGDIMHSDNWRTTPGTQPTQEDEDD